MADAFSLKFQRNNPQNVLAKGSAKGKTGEKACMFTVRWKETTTYSDRAKRKGAFRPLHASAGKADQCLKMVSLDSSSFTSLNSTGLSSRMAIKFGMAMSALQVSASSHTTSSCVSTPTGMAMQ